MARAGAHALDLAQALQREITLLAPPPQPAAAPKTEVLGLYDAMITDVGLQAATRRLFRDGHYALAVEEAYKCLNNLVKLRSGLQNQDGSPLMESAFGSTSGRLRLNDLKTASQRDQQLGYMRIFSGCMTGIRNPRAHEHAYLDAPDVALELLVMANHLARLARASVRRRVRK